MMDTLADRLEGRVSKADLLAIIRELYDRPEEVRTTSRTAPTWRGDYQIGPPHGQDPRSYEKSTGRDSQGFGGRTDRDPEHNSTTGSTFFPSYMLMWLKFHTLFRSPMLMLVIVMMNYFNRYFSMDT